MSGEEDNLFIEEQEAQRPSTAASSSARGIDVRYNIQWDPDFVSEVNMDGREMREKSPPKMKGIDDPSTLMEGQFFWKFLPTKWMEKSLLPAMNVQLLANDKKKTNMPELKVFLACWLNISLHPGYNQKDFFCKKRRTAFWNPPYLGDYMSGRRFEAMGECLMLSNKNRPKLVTASFGCVR